MNACAAKFYQNADKALNVQWRKTLAAHQRSDKELSRWPSYIGPSTDSLLKSQRAWLTYREQNCETVRRTAGGTIAPFLYYVCMFDITQARTDELRRLAMNPVRDDEPL
jgi:uncharacterized protein YecT (DUF1311 family)